MRLLGFSTGGLRASLREALETLGEAGVRAVEVSGAHVDGLAGCGQLLSEFKRVSMHIPKFAPENEAAMAAAMTEVAARGHAVILHPDDISNFALWLPLAADLLIENMDLQKGFGQTTADLARVFARLPDARFCFDLGHAWQVDPTMAEARRFVDAFHLRMGQIHLSSVDRHGQHSCLEPAAVAAFRAILPTIPPHVPFIHEGAPQNRAAMAVELALMNELGAP